MPSLLENPIATRTRTDPNDHSSPSPSRIAASGFDPVAMPRRLPPHTAKISADGKTLGKRVRRSAIGSRTAMAQRPITNGLDPSTAIELSPPIGGTKTELAKHALWHSALSNAAAVIASTACWQGAMSFLPATFDASPSGDPSSDVAGSEDDDAGGLHSHCSGPRLIDRSKPHPCNAILLPSGADSRRARLSADSPDGSDLTSARRLVDSELTMHCTTQGTNSSPRTVATK